MSLLQHHLQELKPHFLNFGLQAFPVISVKALPSINVSWKLNSVRINFGASGLKMVGKFVQIPVHAVCSVITQCGPQ